MRRSKAYSLDLRQAAMHMLNNGQKHHEVFHSLNVSVRTLYRWQKRTTLEPSPTGGSRSRELGISLKELIENNRGKTLKEMAVSLPIQKAALSLRLLKEGFTYKNKAYTYAEGNKAKQDIFKAQVAQFDRNSIYYLDESGFEERAIKEKGWASKGTRLDGKKKENAALDIP